MAFMAVLESDLRALSAEARRRYPAVKDAAEHAILKLRSMSNPSELANSEDILRIFLMACEVKAVKLSVIGLSCLQKLISHNVVPSSAFGSILSTLKDHADMTDENVQLKTLQTVLIIFQSELLPENEDSIAQALGICLHLLENSRSSDSVRSTAAATFRQAVALIFDNVVRRQALPAIKVAPGSHVPQMSLVTEDVRWHIKGSVDFASSQSSTLGVGLTNAGKVGLILLEDLAALATGGSATWVQVYSLHRTYALEIIEFLLANYIAVFQNLLPYKQVLQQQICSLLMTSLRTRSEFEGETGEPSLRRLVLRSVAHIVKLYSQSLITECEVFLNMLIKLTSLDLPLWHRILVLEVLRGFCVEVRTLSLLYQTYDMHPQNTNVVENIVKAFARVVSCIQVPDSSDESLAAVAGMFSSKARGIEWSLDNDASNAAVIIASEAHSITLAVEGLFGVVFTVAALTDEAVDIGEIESPRFDCDPTAKSSGEATIVCISMINSVWFTILDALSLILTRSQGEAIVLEILKAYQAFTQACGVLRAIEPLNSFLASLCKFTLNIQGEMDKRSALHSPGSRHSDFFPEQRDAVVLTPKNVQALRTLFNIAHRLYNVLGPSWMLVLDTLAALDRVINSPYATTQEASTNVSRLPREMSGQYSDFHILSSLNSQLFASSASMHMAAVKSLLSSLHQLSNQFISNTSSGLGQASIQQSGNIRFSIEKTISIVVNNLHRIEAFLDQVINHILEVIHMTEASSPQICSIALDALDQCICAVLGSEHFQIGRRSRHFSENKVEGLNSNLESFECALISPIITLFSASQFFDVQAGSLKILLHILERYGEKLCYSWSRILDLMRMVADTSDKDLIPLGFQSVRMVMNDGLQTLPMDCLHVYIEVIGAYSGQKTEINISLTAVGLLWTVADIIIKGLVNIKVDEIESGYASDTGSKLNGKGQSEGDHETHVVRKENDGVPSEALADGDKLFLLTLAILKNLGTDERPEVRNSAIRMLFQTLGRHGQKFSVNMWESCLWDYVFPILDYVTCLAETSSKDEWQGKELGVRGGKTVHMLVHHSRNTAQKQWDETLVLVIGGLTRILRSSFTFLLTLNNFWAGWEDLIIFIRKSISNGSKEVALAAVSCLQTTVVSHCHKGHLPSAYLKSVLSSYECVLPEFPVYKSIATDKVKQEILLALGDIYAQAQVMFDDDMYLQLLEIIKYSLKSSEDKADVEAGIVPAVQRTVLDVLPLLCPSEQLSSMWYNLMKELTSYLPGLDPFLIEDVPSPQPSVESEALDTTSQSQKDVVKVLNNTFKDGETKISADSSCGTGRYLMNKDQIRSLPAIKASMETATSRLFAQKLVPILLDLFALAPTKEKLNVFPDLIQGLGRCMATRRDNPSGQLWRLAAEVFSRLLLGDIDLLKGDSNSKLSRTRLWKEIADVYENFLVGSCGRALSSEALSSSELQTDELLEMSILHVLGEKILKKQIDAPTDVLERLISTLDRCASRTSCLPVTTVGLIPPHCRRFSLACLQLTFSLCSYTDADDWHTTRLEVSKIAVLLLVKRCKCIFEQFLINEKHLGEHPLPTTMIDEILCVLQELSHIVIHTDTASVLPLGPYLEQPPSREKTYTCRAHLLILFPLLCELVASREVRVREFVQVLLRLIAVELGLKSNSSIG